MQVLKRDAAAKTPDKGAAERFGYQWDRYSEIDPAYEMQFLKWVFPLKKDDFKDRSVLDAGCGMGRNSYWPLVYGAKEVVAFDCDPRTVGSAKRNLSRFPNCSVSRDSIYSIKHKDRFDIVLSIGVIHHLDSPREAVRALVDAAKPGGAILIWVYAYEGNEWIVRGVGPVRKLTSMLPPGLTHLIAYFFSIPLFVRIKLFRSGGEYLAQLRGFGFRHIHLIVFDHLLPGIANYWTKEEVRGLFAAAGVTELEINRVNGNSWTATGRKK